MNAHAYMRRNRAVLTPPLRAAITGALSVCVVVLGLTSLFQWALRNSAGEPLPVFLAALLALVAVVAAGLYVLPTLIAVVRRHPNAIPIGIVNVAFGWTVLGYVVSLAWAFTAQRK